MLIVLTAYGKLMKAMKAMKVMKANSDKSHLLMSGTEETHVNVDDSMIKSTQKEILLGINLNSELKFEDHVNFMCKKASQKLYALARIAPSMDLKQRKNIMKESLC